MPIISEAIQDVCHQLAYEHKLCHIVLETKVKFCHKIH